MLSNAARATHCRAETAAPVSVAVAPQSSVGSDGSASSAGGAAHVTLAARSTHSRHTFVSTRTAGPVASPTMAGVADVADVAVAAGTGAGTVVASE